MYVVGLTRYSRAPRLMHFLFSFSFSDVEKITTGISRYLIFCFSCIRVCVPFRMGMLRSSTMSFGSSESSVIALRYSSACCPFDELHLVFLANIFEIFRHDQVVLLIVVHKDYLPVGAHGAGQSFHFVAA